MLQNPHSELVSLIQKNDKSAKRQVFEAFYSKMAAIALRYAKNQSQAEEMTNFSFNSCFEKLSKNQPFTDLDIFIHREFIAACIAFVKGIRSEYYVASTVYASETASKNYDLFTQSEILDINDIDREILLGAIQQLVPAQRLIFNLHVIDGYSLDEAATLLESSEPTVKSNLEKARFNLQKNIKNSLISSKV